jgi:hypothetical protein
MCFDHKNLLGGGEVGSLVFRRGAQDPLASYKLKYSNNKFGAPYGYEVEGFSEFIGGDGGDDGR